MSRRLTEGLRASNCPSFGIDVRKRPKQLFDGFFRRRCGSHHSIGIVRQKLRQSPGMLETVDVKLDRLVRREGHGRTPQQHQAVLNQRKFVLSAANIGDQAFGEFDRDLSPYSSPAGEWPATARRSASEAPDIACG